MAWARQSGSCAQMFQFGGNFLPTRALVYKLEKATPKS